MSKKKKIIISVTAAVLVLATILTVIASVVSRQNEIKKAQDEYEQAQNAKNDETTSSSDTTPSDTDVPSIPVPDDSGSHITSQNKNDAAVYRKKIQQVCERVEKDFCDKHHFFASWVARKPIILDSGDEVTLNGDRKVIFVLLILNRRRELGLPMFQSDINEFYALCKKANTNFPKGYFKGA